MLWGPLSGSQNCSYYVCAQCPRANRRSGKRDAQYVLVPFTMEVIFDAVVVVDI